MTLPTFLAPHVTTNTTERVASMWNPFRRKPKPAPYLPPTLASAQQTINAMARCPVCSVDMSTWEADRKSAHLAEHQQQLNVRGAAGARRLGL